jgi:hypothetical protein
MPLTNAEKQARWRERQRAKTAALEAELARARAGKVPPDWAALKRAATDARKTNRAAKTPGPAQEGETVETLRAERDALTAQLKGKHTQIANLRARLNSAIAQRDSKGLAMTKQLHREIRACLHPDRSMSESRLTKCSQAFSALKIELVD